MSLTRCLPNMGIRAPDCWPWPVTWRGSTSAWPLCRWRRALISQPPRRAATRHCTVRSHTCCLAPDNGHPYFASARPSRQLRGSMYSRTIGMPTTFPKRCCCMVTGMRGCLRSAQRWLSPLTSGAFAADAAFAGQVGLVRQILVLNQGLATAVSTNGGRLAQSSSAWPEREILYALGCFVDSKPRNS